MRTLFTAMLLLGALLQPYAQPGILWENSFGGTFTDMVGTAVPTLDGGYMVLSMPYSLDGDVLNSHGGSDFWLKKLDQNGQMIWQKTFGGTLDEEAVKILPTADSCFLLLGETKSIDGDVSGNHGDWDIWLLKVNQEGELIWKKTYGGSNFDGPTSIIPATDGGYIITAATLSKNFDVPFNSLNDINGWVFKINDVGAIQWTKVYGGNGDDFISSIFSRPDGGYVMGGTSRSTNIPGNPNAGFTDTWTLKTNVAGTLESQKIIGGEGLDYIIDALPVGDSDLLVFCTSSSLTGPFNGNHGQRDFLVYRLDANNNVLWHKYYGGSNLELLYSVSKMANGNFVLAGSTGSSDGDLVGNYGSNSWLLCIRSSGLIVWSKTYGGSGADRFNYVNEISPGEFLAVGRTSSNDGDVQSGVGASNNGDIWVVRLSSTVDTENEPATASFEVTTSPNPAANYIEILSDDPLEHCNLTVFSMLGVVCLQQKDCSSRKIDISTLRPGTYFLVIDNDGRSVSKMFVKM